jgi:tetratricopeptide (TPR) repeat protein
MSLRNIHSDLKELLKEAIANKDYKKAMAILEKFSSPYLSKNANEDIDAILFKDVKNIVKSKEDLENILLSTKVAFENKDEVIDFFKLLIDYGFKENALDYFEDFLKELNDLEIIDGFNSLLKK